MSGAAPPPPAAPEPLDDSHILTEFDCGNENLSNWLKKNAGQSQRKRSARTFVIHRNKLVIGYYSLAAGSISPDKAAPKVSKGLAQRLDVPIILLARLAIDQREQGKGFGDSLLRDALLRSISVSKDAGIRAVVVDAIDEKARAFYMKYEFEPSPVDAFRLMLLIQDIRANAA